jgi:hypothetical protein
MKKKEILHAVQEDLRRALLFAGFNNEIPIKAIELIVKAYFDALLERTVIFSEDFKTPIGTFYLKNLKPRKGKTPEGKDFSVGERSKLSFRQNNRTKGFIESETNLG